MKTKTRSTLLALGFDTNLIEKIAANRHTVTALRALSDAALELHYTEAERLIINDHIRRKPIPADVLARVITASDKSCCFCADGNSARPYQIHHIVEYSKTQDNSEDNLLLICPSHHESIPKHFAPAEQKGRRRSWHSIVKIARAYRTRGLEFPYGLFVAKDYETDPRPEELVLGYRLSASTALAVSRHELAYEAVARLQSTGFLLIVGASGDGKSTLATGIGGLLSKDGMPVFSYQRPVVFGSLPLKDILTFVEAADQTCVLLLDDANLYLNETQLAEIATAANKSIVVIATWTRGSLSDAIRLQRQFFDPFLVSWERLRDSIRRFLLANESVIVKALQQFPHSWHFPLGVGYMNTSLLAHITRYEQSAQTAAEFFFLVRGGEQVVNTEIEELAKENRSDVPVLFAAVEQIAGFERLVTPGEAAEACRHVQLSARRAATEEWVEEVFQTQRNRGRMEEERGAYTTIHRDWGARLIEAACNSPLVRPEMELLLVPNLDLRSTEPMRLMRTWTWLWHKIRAGSFVRDRLAKATVEDWTSLVNRAIHAGMLAIGVAADRMHLLFDPPNWEKVIARAFVANQSELRLLLDRTTPNDLHSLRSLAMALGHASPTLAAEIWNGWQPAKVASLVEQADPDSYEDASWMFSSIKKHSREWVKEVGALIQWNEISRNLQKVAVGDLRTISVCDDLLRTVERPILRSMIRRFSVAMADVLRNARLADLQLSLPGRNWWICFPGEVRQVIGAIDLGRMTEDLVRSRPREWRILAELSAFLGPIGDEFLSNLFQRMHPNAFIANVQGQAEGCEYELRCLVWVLSRIRSGRRIDLAQGLYSCILDACRRSEMERPNLIRALAAMHKPLAGKVSAELAYTASEAASLDEGESMTTQDTIERIRQRYAELDASGEDYDVDAVLGDPGPHEPTD